MGKGLGDLIIQHGTVHSTEELAVEAIGSMTASSPLIDVLVSSKD